MKNVSIKQVLLTTDSAEKIALDAFYKAHGSPSTARPGDLFFIAYADNEIVGCVRYCVEFDTAMLRTMRVANSFQKQGIGSLLLKTFAKYLDQNKIKNVFCLPYTHLEKFYGSVGFELAPEKTVPEFLIQRSLEYKNRGTVTLYMRRP